MKKIILFIAIIVLLNNVNIFASKGKKSYINEMVENSLIDISMTKNINNSIEKDLFVAILINLYEKSSQNYVEFKAETFKDLSNNEYKNKIEKAYKLYFVVGTSKNTFSPKDKISRAQAVTLIANFIDTNNLKIAPLKKEITFSDEKDVPTWAKEASKRMVLNGLINLKDENEFRPKDYLTKEEAFLIFYNMAIKLKTFEKKEDFLQQYGLNYARGNDFFVYKNKAYFKTDGYFSDNKIYCINLKSKSQIPVKYTKYSVDKFFIEDGFLYATEIINDSKHQLVKIDLLKGTKEVLSNLLGGSDLQHENGYLYVISGRKYIYKMKLDGTFAFNIYNSESAISNLCVYDGKVYFNKKGSGIVKISSNGSEKSNLTNSEAKQIVVKGNNLYFTKKNATRELSELAETDLYYIDLSKKTQNKTEEKILDRIGNVYTSEVGVFAYQNEPLEENSLFEIKDKKATKMNSPSYKLLCLNNAKNLRFSRDKKLYYSVYKTKSKDDYYDDTTFEYSNVIDMNSNLSNSLTGGPALIHSAKELEVAYNKVAYAIYENTDSREKETILKSENIVKELIKPGMTDYQKEKAIHDYIVLNTVYDTSITPSNDIKVEGEFYRNDFNPTYANFSDDVFDIKGVILNEKAVCDGYAKTAKLLLTMAGIECYYVKGTAATNLGTFNHSWNIVKIGGNFYQLDVTWDDSILDSKENVSYKYFNLTDEEISKNHTKDNSAYPKCVTTWVN